ncbi:MAG: aminopeptidase P family N-terminal domain-containing protein, partial [Coriobacteriales bacterium]|nr:aminopeptidase P family N-terminal domain-containing protein [Coriobacteriales bacterium]
MSVINRINRLRGLMDERNYDACLLRDVASLRWLTGAVRVFDNETAHTALITKDNLWFHTDSRY